MRILSVLTRTIYVDGENTKAPSWLISTRRNTVKLIQYNHLNQSQVLEEIRQRTVPWPEDYTVQDNRLRLQQYIQNKASDTVIGDRTQIAGGARKNCDLCYSLMAVSPRPPVFRARPFSQTTYISCQINHIQPHKPPIPTWNFRIYVTRTHSNHHNKLTSGTLD